MNSPLLDGIQPHLGMSALHSPSSSSATTSPLPLPQQYHTPRSCVLDKEFIKNVDLPGLSADDIEAVLSENQDWSGEQIDQFLHSAVDLSEIESKLFSLAGYESDSGYSTYDVSPITSSAPANLSYSTSQVTSMPSCPPPPLTLINHHSTSPLFGNPGFGGLPPPPMHPHPSPSPLIHEAAAAGSPCGSDGGFFSSHSSFGSLASTPSQESMPFFPPPPPLPHAPPLPPPPQAQPSLYNSQQPYSHAQDFSTPAFSITTCFPDIASSSALPSFSLQIPDIILHDMNPHHHNHHHQQQHHALLSSCPVPPLTSDTKYIPPGCVGQVVGKLPEEGGEEEVMENPCLMPPHEATQEEVSSGVKAENCLPRAAGSCAFEKIDPPNVSCPLPPSCSVPHPPPPAAAPISMPSPPALTSQAPPNSSDPASQNPTPLRALPDLINAERCGPNIPCNGNGNNPQQYPIITQFRYSKDMNVTVSTLPMRKGKPGGVAKVGKPGVKAAQKKKTQWPRSMNRANLIAFREHILNKLKKAQETGTGGGSGSNGISSSQVLPIQVLASKGTADKAKAGEVISSGSATPIKAPSPNNAFEVEVKYERNHLTPPKRCHSEPADVQGAASSSSSAGGVGHTSLHYSQSDSNLSAVKLSPHYAAEEMRLLALGGGSHGSEEEECSAGDLLSEFNFNPDTFLAPHLDKERLASQLELKFSMEGAEEEGEILDLFEEGVVSKHPHCPSTSSLSEVDMEMDCIHNLLDSTKPAFSSNSPSPLGSPHCTASSCGGRDSSGSGHHTPLTAVGTSSASLSRSDSVCSVAIGEEGVGMVVQQSSAGSSPPPTVTSQADEDSFKFPEILSIQGSMVLDGVSVMSGEGEASSSYQPQHAFLQSHHDPLLADSHPTHPTSVELFEF